MAEDVDFSIFPSYLYGADNHNLGKDKSSWLDPTSWEFNAENIPRFIASATVSGASSFYNTGVAVANWFGAEAEAIDVERVLTNYDDDLGLYYRENKEAADLAGFIAFSFIPGIAGMKAFGAGQKMLAAAKIGAVGKNMSRFTGLLTPGTDMYIAKAATELAQHTATFSYINGNVIKALGAGVGQAALESAAFETAVAATMFKSPVLDQMDTKDLLVNIAVGTAFGGTIGGVFTGAKSVGKIKKTLTGIDKLETPYKYIHEVSGGSPSDRIISRFADLEAIPPVDPASPYAARFTQAAQDKTQRLNNLLMQDVRALAKGDEELALSMYNSLRGLDSTQVMKNLLGAKEVGTLSTRLKVEGEIKRALKPVRTPFKYLAAEDIVETEGKEVAYVKLWGDDAGSVFFESPKSTSIIDRLGKDEASRFTAAQGFKLDSLFDIQKADFDAVEARYVWAKLQKLPVAGQVIDQWDIPLLEQAVLQKPESVLVRYADVGDVMLTTHSQMFKAMQDAKEELANKLLNSKVKVRERFGRGFVSKEIGKYTTDDISKVTNVRKSYLEGIESLNIDDDLLARQYFTKQYTDDLISRGLWARSKGEYDVGNTPQWLKVGFRKTPISDIDGNIVEGMAYIKAKEKLHLAAIDNVFANEAGNIADQFIRPSDEMLLGANREGAGSRVVSFANGNYGSLASVMESNGAATNRLRQSFRRRLDDALTPVTYQLSNDLESAVEWNTINELLARTPEKYVLDESGTKLIPRALVKYQEAVAAGKLNLIYPDLKGAPEEIVIRSEKAKNAVQAHIDLNGKRLVSFKNIRAVQGMEDAKDPLTFYPIKPDPRDYSHFAFVIDDTVTGSGHVTMIHATSSKELEDMITRTRSATNYKVVTKSQSEEFHKALGDFDYTRTLHENYIDVELRSKGVNSQFIPQTDPILITKKIQNFHQRGEDILARELVSMKLDKEFTELRRLGEQYTSISASKYASTQRYAEDVVKNPYMNYIKTALDISSIKEYPLLVSLNNLLDSAVSEVFKTVDDVFAKVKTPEELALVQRVFDEKGLKTAYYDAAMDALANKTPARGYLTNFVRQANSLLSTLVLRLDPLNAINNSAGANVLLGAETKSLVRAIQAGNKEAAGKLAGLLEVQIPGSEIKTLSSGRLISNSMQRWFGPQKLELIAEYKRNGWITDLSTQFHKMVDDLTIRGTETPRELGDRMKSAFAKAKKLGEVGEKWTGNTYAEEFNRFVAADVMKQITDIAQSAGVLTASESTAYINTFVNRTQGNILASQRPLLFQGPIGQAIGLFQTYQFNLIQQMLRYVSEGTVKDAATLLGLQGTIYGMNGLPAFNFINQHIIGTASGNPNHRDSYDAIYGIAGKTAGDFLMYGLPSNLLRVNLYTRGDINPRQVTVVPVNPVDIPIVGAYGKFLTSMGEVVSKTANGGSAWESFLQGIEHNGLSRPMAGLAQVVRGLAGGDVYSTSTRGNILGANDLFSLASVTRLVGGKPFDESIVNDAVYRINAYQAVDRGRKLALNEAVKSTLIGGGTPSQDDIENFAAKYAALGGKQRQFNQWMMEQYKNANTSQANQIAEHLKSPFAQKMQTIMGGTPMNDTFN